MLLDKGVFVLVATNDLRRSVSCVVQVDGYEFLHVFTPRNCVRKTAHSGFRLVQHVTTSRIVTASLRTVMHKLDARSVDPVPPSTANHNLRWSAFESRMPEKPFGPSRPQQRSSCIFTPEEAPSPQCSC